MAVVLPEKRQEALVVVWLHIEELHQQPVIAVRGLETDLDDLATVHARQVARHEDWIDGRPERLALFDHERGQFIGAAIVRYGWIDGFERGGRCDGRTRAPHLSGGVCDLERAPRRP